MKISKKDWQNYIARLRKINDTAADKVANFMNTHDCRKPEGVKQLIDYSHAVATKYGEGAAELSCQMLDAVADASSVYVPAAEPAATATYAEIAKTIYGTLATTRDPHAVGAAVGRSVKLASVDTLQQNALRDGAEWAWIPAGDTCPFCLMLASRGWVRASKKAIKNGHADHIHNNCDCTYCVRYDGETTVEGYDPEALYEQYVNAGETPRERLNALRRQQYASNPEKYRAQSRAAYARAKAGQPIDYIDAKRFANDNLDLINMLRSNDVQDISTAVDLILTKDYSLGGSAWKKKAIIVNANSLRPGAVAVSDWDNIIKMRKEYVNDLKIHIHEQLHMRSINKYGPIKGPSILAQNLPLEEGTVEYLAQEICKRNGVNFKKAYKEYVDPIERFRQITRATQSRYDFARELFDRDLTERYNYLKEISDAYKASRPYLRKAVEDELDDILKFLKGGAQ